MSSKIIKSAGIGRKLIVYILLFSSVVTFLGTSLQLYLDYTHDINSIQDTMIQIESSYLQSISSSLWYMDAKQVTIVLNGILRLPNMQHLEIRQEGKLFISAGQPQQDGIIQREFQLSYKFKGQDQELGVLKVTASLTGIYKRLWSRISVILSTQAVKTFLVSAFIFYLFYILVGRHLVFMADYAKRLDFKLLNTPLDLKRKPPKNDDELETLVQSINTMRKNIARDITEREQAEEALRENEEKYRTLFERESDAIFIFDPDTTNILDANAATSKMYGYDHDEIIGMSCLKFSAEVKESTSTIDRLHEDGEVNVPDRLHCKKDGTVFPVDISAYTVTIEGKNVMYAVSKDITARTQAEESLRESKNRFRDITHSMADWIWEVDKDGKYTYISDTVKSILEYSPDELIGKTPFDLMPAEEAVKIGEIFSEIASKSRTIVDLENWNLAKSGTEVCLLTNGVPIIDADGELLGYRGVDKDITGQKKLEAEKTEIEARLQQSQKMESIGTLAGGIAHDFNNVLYSIIGYTELSIEDVPDGSLVQKNLQEALKGTMRAKDMVQQILTFSRNADTEKKPIKVQSVVKEALQFLRTSIPSTIDIQQRINVDCGPVMADPTQIHQVVMNLATNAYQAMRDKGGVLGLTLLEEEIGSDKLDLDLEPGTYLKLTVSDTGQGMDSVVMNRVFDPYFTTKKVGEGTGMGLAVVHGIVKDHGGDIMVYSKIAEGTSFHAYFPLLETRQVESEIITTELTPTGTERILFVDDEEAIVFMTQQTLERLGYQVTARTSSVEAQEAFRAKPDEFDLVITDMTMPNMTGLELASRLREIRADIPIIICTGYSEIIDGDKAKARGILGYVMKPVTKAEIARTIRQVLDKEE